MLKKLKQAWKLYKIYKEVKRIMADSKKGIKSSEMYVTIATIIASIWFALSGSIPPELCAKIVLIAGAVYTICRTVVKLTPTKADDELLEKIVKQFKKK